MTEVWSNGGGVQSAAIAALILQKKLPKPDLAAIIDTERERSAVWSYLDQIIRPALASINLELHRIPKSEFTDEDLFVQWADDPRPQLLMPAFVANPDGSLGRLSTMCSSRWKRRILQRWLRKRMHIKSCNVWLGISLDEMQRVRTSSEAWYQHHYPLIFDFPMRRSECLHLVQQMGWPLPPRSACWMCPNRIDSEWLEMQRTAPDDFAKAILLERDIRSHRPDFFLHRSLRPLDQIDFNSSQLSMISDNSNPHACTEGCFT